MHPHTKQNKNTHCFTVAMTVIRTGQKTAGAPLASFTPPSLALQHLLSGRETHTSGTILTIYVCITTSAFPFSHFSASPWPKYSFHQISRLLMLFSPPSIPSNRAFLITVHKRLFPCSSPSLWQHPCLLCHGH